MLLIGVESSVKVTQVEQLNLIFKNLWDLGSRIWDRRDPTGPIPSPDTEDNPPEQHN